VLWNTPPCDGLHTRTASEFGFLIIERFTEIDYRAGFSEVIGVCLDPLPFGDGEITAPSIGGGKDRLRIRDGRILPRVGTLNFFHIVSVCGTGGASRRAWN